ncbi:ribosome biogenesis/translation initiation ATPase RLI [Candidatus Woesearchaeota archaeon]|nr:MAG: ribosome biogenesis/translation initiation ATPase RLI [Candidatus Woesearchaeota archaeon]
MARIAIVEREKCINGKACDFICGKYCPMNRTDAECIIINENDNKAVIDEKLCTGCGICIKKCPAKCIDIVNLPEKLKEKPIHRYGQNMFELFRLPIPKKGYVVGILGRNGIGKSTALAILAGSLKPNLGDYDKEVTKEDVINHYSTTYLGEYFRKLFEGKVKVAYKPQRIELIPKMFEGTVGELLYKVDERNVVDDYMNLLEVEHLKERKLNQLSGGELQRVAIIATAAKNAEVYYFDEPASFCDITTRIKVAKLIRSLLNEKCSIIVVEHDLATLDYISDEIQIIYGKQGAYGVVSQTKGVSRGINEYLDGYLPDDNVRFRPYPIKFEDVTEVKESEKEILKVVPPLKKSFENFGMSVRQIELKKGDVLAVMGANGLGKTTLLNMLAGEIKPDEGEVEKFKISYKVQYPDPNVEGTVRDVLMNAAKNKFHTGWYKQNILDKLGMERVIDNQVKNLSGGELQKLYIAVTLSKDCDIYAFDEPSAFIDVEDRLKVAEVIKEFMIKNEVAAIVVDHDVQFIDYIADSMLVFEGNPGVEGHVYGPVSKREGMNHVLKMLDITYRRDATSLRPRINKPNSQLDKQQREKGEYYYN